MSNVLEVGKTGFLDFCDKLVKNANFYVLRQCGKCTPCREGTKRMLEILERIASGKGQAEDIETLESLGKVMKTTSLCGLGQTAPTHVLSTLECLRNGKLPDEACFHIPSFAIIEEKCKGCGLCAKKCPVNCISGKVKEPYLIDTDKCILCGTCMEKCKFDAVIRK